MSYSFLLIFSFLMLAAQCASDQEEVVISEFPEVYDFEARKVLDMPGALREISGIEWVDGQILAIQDEAGVLFWVNPENGEITENKSFGKNGDYEDITLINDQIWVLESNGTLHHIKDYRAAELESEKYKFPIKERRDFESLVQSQDSQKLISICKDCKWDKNEKEASAYSFDPNVKEYSDQAAFQLVKKQIEERLNVDYDKSVKIQPSAAALHPIDQEYYIISSTGSWLAIFDLDFNIKKLYRLNTKVFKQPEGITFSPNGTLYISNEARGGRANILVFPLK
ncbi:SdiA-regulated domain-containing protein [Algoriphagus sediminis]|uniref:SdiA-regulated domain-containing protein n=1 Tax=Algoriphagus sediminis TaxID=3057113 RepID=A0ABT7Y9Q0_9BACT|nr:SdiA-regulated domain-containing protein [Algoriphagus sediminis]MDN3203241.1 SdiA-regulated domain-containing protein [Algoriphagus sediminis]